MSSISVGLCAGGHVVPAWAHHKLELSEGEFVVSYLALFSPSVRRIVFSSLRNRPMLEAVWSALLLHGKLSSTFDDLYFRVVSSSVVYLVKGSGRDLSQFGAHPVRRFFETGGFALEEVQVVGPIIEDPLVEYSYLNAVAEADRLHVASLFGVSFRYEDVKPYLLPSCYYGIMGRFVHLRPEEMYGYAGVAQECQEERDRHGCSATVGLASYAGSSQSSECDDRVPAVTPAVEAEYCEAIEDVGKWLREVRISEGAERSGLLDRVDSVKVESAVSVDKGSVDLVDGTQPGTCYLVPVSEGDALKLYRLLGRYPRTVDVLKAWHQVLPDRIPAVRLKFDLYTTMLHIERVVGVVDDMYCTKDRLCGAVKDLLVGCPHMLIGAYEPGGETHQWSSGAPTGARVVSTGGGVSSGSTLCDEPRDMVETDLRDRGGYDESSVAFDLSRHSESPFDSLVKSECVAHEAKLARGKSGVVGTVVQDGSLFVEQAYLYSLHPDGSCDASAYLAWGVGNTLLDASKGAPVVYSGTGGIDFQCEQFRLDEQSVLKLAGLYVVRGRFVLDGWEIDARQVPVAIRSYGDLHVLCKSRCLLLDHRMRVLRATTNTDSMAEVYDTGCAEVYYAATRHSVREWKPLDRSNITSADGILGSDGTVSDQVVISPKDPCQVMSYASCGATLFDVGPNVKFKFGCFVKHGGFRIVVHRGLINLNSLGVVLSSYHPSVVKVLGVSDSYEWDCRYVDDDDLPNVSGRSHSAIWASDDSDVGGGVEIKGE